MLFDFFHMGKRIKPLIESMDANKDALRVLSLQATEQFAHMQRAQKELSLQAAEQFTHMQTAQKELSLQVEELYDYVSDAKSVDEGETKPLVDALIALRENIEHLSVYSHTRDDEDLKHQMELFITVCDRKLSAAGIWRIEREGKPYDCAMDVAVDVAYVTDMEPNMITKVLSECYTYRGAIVKRAEVVICKGETYA